MVKLNRIYTRTGDAGLTGLVDGSRVAKDDARLIAIGEIDEANSAIGIALATLTEGPLRAELLRMQNDLFDLGADVATPGEDFAPTASALRIVPEQVTRIEAAIDALNADLSPLTSFVLPGGTAAAAALFLARAVVRRAERALVGAARAVAINPHALAYLNRLSDYLFVAARHANIDAGGDIAWVPGASRG